MYNALLKELGADLKAVGLFLLKETVAFLLPAMAVAGLLTYGNPALTWHQWWIPASAAGGCTALALFMRSSRGRTIWTDEERAEILAKRQP
jgi:hypothetical protein